MSAQHAHGMSWRLADVDPVGLLFVLHSLMAHKAIMLQQDQQQHLEGGFGPLIASLMSFHLLNMGQYAFRSANCCLKAYTQFDADNSQIILMVQS